MEAFRADWLALRESADHAARAEGVTAGVAARLARRRARRAIDLAAGTGSNVRYLLSRLPGITHWTLVDHDAALLSVARASLEPIAGAAGVTIETMVADLRVVDALPLDGCALVTASALLDLVSPAWLRAVAARCDDVQADVLFALTYDGRVECDPPDPWDARVRDLVNRHQRTDKGFGPALGPDATAAAEAAFAARGVTTSASDWLLDAGQTELQRQLLAGWAGAAQTMAPDDASGLDGWLKRRLALVEQGRSRLRVGHRDLAA